MALERLIFDISGRFHHYNDALYDIFQSGLLRNIYEAPFDVIYLLNDNNYNISPLPNTTYLFNDLDTDDTITLAVFNNDIRKIVVAEGSSFHTALNSLTEKLEDIKDNLNELNRLKEEAELELYNMSNYGKIIYNARSKAFIMLNEKVRIKMNSTSNQLIVFPAYSFDVVDVINKCGYEVESARKPIVELDDKGIPWKYCQTVYFIKEKTNVSGHGSTIDRALTNLVHRLEYFGYKEQDLRTPFDEDDGWGLWWQPSEEYFPS